MLPSIRKQLRGITLRNKSLADILARQNAFKRIAIFRPACVLKTQGNTYYLNQTSLIDNLINAYCGFNSEFVQTGDAVVKFTTPETLAASIHDFVNEMLYKLDAGYEIREDPNVIALPISQVIEMFKWIIGDFPMTTKPSLNFEKAREAPAQNQGRLISALMKIKQMKYVVSGYSGKQFDFVKRDM